MGLSFNSELHLRMVLLFHVIWLSLLQKEISPVSLILFSSSFQIAYYIYFRPLQMLFGVDSGKGAINFYFGGRTQINIRFQ